MKKEGKKKRLQVELISADFRRSVVVTLQEKGAAAGVGAWREAKSFGANMFWPKADAVVACPLVHD